MTLYMQSPWDPKPGYTLGASIFSLTASPTNHNIFVPTSQLPRTKRSQTILDFADKGQKHAYKKNFFGSGSTANCISDLRGKFHFRCAASKSRRSVKVVLGSLEWQQSGQITVLSLARYSFCDTNDDSVLCQKLPF
jgi:hypothetical protein